MNNLAIEKQNIINLFNKKKTLLSQLSFFEKRNNLLTNSIDLDYLETLYRDKFMVGKTTEKIFKAN